LVSRRKRKGEQPLTKLALQYQLHGNRYAGHPRRRWREQDYLKVNEVQRIGFAALNEQCS